jgi:hypothetical protein
MFRLPTTATAPFCPSEVRGSVFVAPGAPLWQRILPIWPLIRLTSDPAVMGRYANGLLTRVLSWSLFVLISAANIWLMARFTFR